MCVGDWRLGRLVRAVVSTRVVSAGGTAIIAASQQRVGISIDQDASSYTAASVLDIIVDGITLSGELTLRAGWFYNVLKHGDMPTKKFTLSNGGGGDLSANVIEYFLPESVLATALESLRSEYNY